MGNFAAERDKAIRLAHKRWAQEAADAEKSRRMALAEKIVLAVVDRISADIIRPGPKPEERECYVMAKELRDHSTPLKVLVEAILAAEGEDADHG